MTDYTCPNCTGGFPADALDDGACPWCDHQLGTTREEMMEAIARMPRTKTVTKVVRDEPEETTVLGKLRSLFT